MLLRILLLRKEKKGAWYLGDILFSKRTTAAHQPSSEWMGLPESRDSVVLGAKLRKSKSTVTRETVECIRINFLRQEPME
mmetsp:Transcript_4205/g.8738  ORF Transcript_4205/g.8738 Transcript_4205/m.8738 type:complete len:80 (-) Transcript_4205:371-610(-)